MKRLKVPLIIFFALALAFVLVATIYILRANKFQRDGETTLPILESPVKVIRDEKGMAYIYANNLPDALRAMGFVTAQDRLFQMELTRLVANGRLSELAGEKTKTLDIRMRTLGLKRHAKQHARILNSETERFFQAYIDGINHYVKMRKRYHPFEFKLAGIKPEPWSIEDALAIAYLMSWNNSGNLLAEITTQMLIEKLGLKKAKGIFPITINPDEKTKTKEQVTNKNQKPQESIARAKPGVSTLPALLELFSKDFDSSSNNWVVGPDLSRSGKPLLANDPHLDTRILPGPFYPIALITPTLRTIGVTVPGLPIIAAGRNEHVAWGITNSYNDTQDLYVETTDPKNPNYYLEGNTKIPFKIINETLKIRDKKSKEGFREETFTIRYTKRGPVISHLIPEFKSKHVLSLRWVPYETMESSVGLNELIFAKSTGDIRKALSRVTIIMLNVVFADTQGNIGWQTTGRIPIRAQVKSEFPYRVKDGTDNWVGWLSFDDMPHLYNPSRKWVGTCNHKTVTKDYPYYISSMFATHYRYARLSELIKPGIKTEPIDHWKFQGDTKNKLAESITDKISKILLEDKNTEILGNILSGWDFHDSKNLVAPTIFHGIFHEAARLTFSDEIGEKITDEMLKVKYFWVERFEKMILDGDSPWFDNVNTDAKETMGNIFHSAGNNLIKKLEVNYGKQTSRWIWGNVHRKEFLNPLIRNGPLKKLLGSGPYPMGGSGDVLYRAYDFENPYGANLTAALRMVVDLADGDKILAVIPGGVSGRTFDPHNKDQIKPYMKGEEVYWWFSDDTIKKHKKHTLMLLSQKVRH